MLRMVLIAAGVFVAWYIVWTIYLAVVLKWSDDASNGLGYYGRTPERREAFKRALRVHAVLLAPAIWLNSRIGKLDFKTAVVRHQGLAFPMGSCDAASLERATSYIPRAGDVFVCTQMKCGTTWMEHIVYEVLHRGAGTLVASGTTLYALAPWLEGRKSVPLADAPLLGAERPSRIIKTHLPADLCPRGQAKYIYVARHPVSCFASCVDFVRTNVGNLAPAPEKFEQWFTSNELMWWGPWTRHVAGWWERSQMDNNVLFLHFEDMKKDLAGVTRQVAAFLGVPSLTEEELARVVHKCGFDYMQEHQDNFEMHPPHILQTNAQMFVRGSADRHKDVPAEARERIRAWVVEEMRGAAFPLARAWPDVMSAG